MYHDFLGPRGLQGSHGYIKIKIENENIQREGFFTFLAILDHSAPPGGFGLSRCGGRGCCTLAGKYHFTLIRFKRFISVAIALSIKKHGQVTAQWK